MISLALLGSTGSIGTQTLDVVERFPDRFDVVLLSAGRASPKLLEQARKFHPRFVITEEEPSKGWLTRLPEGTVHLRGVEGLKEALLKTKPQKVLNAVGGIFGIEPSFAVLELTSAQLLLANKETVIAAGELLKPHLGRIVPVDSEHNAIFQLLEGIKKEEISKLILTASGGPFRGKREEELKTVKVEDALSHPRWRMGKKITVDSATLMNKGFEVIEAHYLFDLPFERIEVLVHPESIVHGMVETVDGNLLALLSPTDMRFPIQHALFYPERVNTPLKRLDLTEIGRLTFEKPDTETFKCLKLAYRYGKKGFPHTAFLVGADEGAVELFLKGEITFVDIPEVIEKTVEELSGKVKTRKIDLWEIPRLVKEAYKTSLKGGRRKKTYEF